MYGTLWIHITDRHNKWYTFLVYELEKGVTFVCVVRSSWLRDAVSGFEEHATTICEQEDGDTEKGLYIMRGNIRIDGSFGNKRRTAVLMTADIDDETIQKVMGV